MTRIAVIDFEASCLPDAGMSFPIEVALAEVDGPSRVWLIKPHPRWRYWDWTEEAERLHGLSLDTIERDGMPVEDVLEELARAAEGCSVFADSELDAFLQETIAIRPSRSAISARYSSILVSRATRSTAPKPAPGP